MSGFGYEWSGADVYLRSGIGYEWSGIGVYLRSSISGIMHKWSGTCEYLWSGIAGIGYEWSGAGVYLWSGIAGIGYEWSGAGVYCVYIKTDSAGQEKNINLNIQLKEFYRNQDGNYSILRKYDKWKNKKDTNHIF